MNDTRTAILLALIFVASTAMMTGASTQTHVEKYDAHLVNFLTAPDADAARVIIMTVGAPAPVAAAASALGAEVTWTYDIIDGFAATVPRGLLATLSARPDVASIWLDRPVTTLMDVSAKAIGADKAWAAGYKGAGITVAVIDTGIDQFHPYFAGAIVKCVSTISGVVSPECTDSDGHGTHVAGTVASRHTTYRGVAPEASLAVVRVLHAAGAGVSSDIIRGIQWVQANQNLVTPPIKVATMSIGFLSPGCGNDLTPEALAANALVNSGVVFTVAAGNSGHATCTIDGASAASKVITVGANDDRGTITQADDTLASFSSGGPTSDGRLKPDVTFPGVKITSAFPGGGLLIATMDGTSMATPHAAGAAALLLQQNSGWTPSQVKTRINNTAVSNANTGVLPNNDWGYGIGNVCYALGLASC